MVDQADVYPLLRDVIGRVTDHPLSTRQTRPGPAQKQPNSMECNDKDPKSSDSSGPCCMPRVLSAFFAERLRGELTPDYLRTTARKREGHILNKEPVVGVFGIHLANDIGPQMGWESAGRISSVAQNGEH